MSKGTLLLLAVAGLLALNLSFAYGDTVTEDSSGTIWVKGTDGTTTYCYTIGEGPNKKVICHDR